jgi:hypothetical protein
VNWIQALGGTASVVKKASEISFLLRIRTRPLTGSLGAHDDSDPIMVTPRET